MADGQLNPLDYARPPSRRARPDVEAAAIAAIVGSAVAVWTAVRGGFVFACWTAAPYFLLAVIAWFVSTGRVSRAILVVAVLSMLAFGYWAYGSVNHDAQGGLLFLLVPLYQLAAAVVVSVVIVIIRFRSSRRTFDEP